jgi:hypothetical protein
MIRSVVLMMLVISVGLTGLPPAVAERAADPVTFRATGTVDYVDADLAGTFSIGDAFVLEWTFDPTTLDTNGSANRGDYAGAISAVAFQVGSYSGSATSGSITVFDNLVGKDEYSIVVSSPPSGPPIGDFELGVQAPLLQLIDFSETAVTNDSLPVEPAVLKGFDFLDAGDFLALNFECATTGSQCTVGDTASVSASIDSVTYAMDPVTFRATGTVDYVDADLAGTFSIGDAFVLEWTFDPTTLDTNGSANRGDYAGAISAVAFQVGSYSGSATSGSITVFDNLVGKDEYSIVVSSPPSGPPIGDFELGVQAPLLQLIDFSETAVTNDSLPVEPSDLECFDFLDAGDFLALNFECATTGSQCTIGDMASVSASLDSVTYASQEKVFLPLILK